jgi:hypothetical protein
MPATADRVADVKLNTAVPVYDLTIAPGWLPEFFANGILIHNCTWYPEIGWSPDRLDAMVWGGWHNKVVRTTASTGRGFGNSSALDRAIG